MRNGMIRRVMLATVVLAAAGPARAEWLEATSRHFVVFADGRPAEVQKMATDLERFDAVIRRFHNIPDPDDAASNRVTVYVSSNVAAVQRLYGKAGSNVYGFYVPRASGSVAFTPKNSGSGPGDLSARIVLFHEYAHHFMLGNYAIAYPGWFSEGYAEFVSTMTFEKDYAQLGVAAQHRAWGLYGTSQMTVRDLFAADTKHLSPERNNALYARGWLLTHYIIFDEARRKTLGTYLALLNAGKPSMAAATEAFGDLGALNRALDGYLAKSRIPGVRIPYSVLPEPRVAVRPLSRGAAALMGDRMISERGVGRERAAEVFARAAPIAAANPDDAEAQGWFAEMAYDAGRDAEAEAAADRALTVDPKSTQALLYKARVHLRRAAAAKSTNPAVWAEARGWIIKANRLDPDAAEPLAMFYRSFRMAHETPRKSAIAGLRRAFELMPQDGRLRFTYAAQLIAEKDYATAATVLRPIAFDPHAGPDNPAARLVALLDTAGTDPSARSRIDDALNAGSAGKGGDGGGDGGGGGDGSDD